MSNVDGARLRELRNKIIAGRTVADWDEGWEEVTKWRTADTPALRAARGLVRFTWNGEVVAILRASDNQRGMVKKFSDYIRPSDSSRDHPVGRRIYEHRAELTAHILVTGENKDMERVNIDLKRIMVELYRPTWMISKRM